MYLINKTYFKNDLELPVFDSNTGVSEKADDYIQIYVVDFLQKLLGSVDFEELNSNIVDGALSITAPQRWKDLVNGKSYEKDGKTYFWKGLLYQNGTVKLSILTNIVYCRLMVDLHTGNGKNVINVKNSLQLVPGRNFRNAWNEIALQLNYSLPCRPKISYVDGVRFTDYYASGNQNNNYSSLADFLNDFKEVYENVNLNLGYNIKNQFDLE